MSKEYDPVICLMHFFLILKFIKVKTNLGRARAFLRFCLQYHRLADAVQQLTMEDKLVANWYGEKCVWLNEAHKSRIIQLLYDLNEVNFELIAKNNFELDSQWPTMQLNDGSSRNPGAQTLGQRNRTASISSFSSIMTENTAKNAGADSSMQLLSSTPLEMDDDLMFANINHKVGANEDEDEGRLG